MAAQDALGQALDPWDTGAGLGFRKIVIVNVHAEVRKRVLHQRECTAEGYVGNRRIDLQVCSGGSVVYLYLVITLKLHITGDGKFVGDFIGRHPEALGAVKAHHAVTGFVYIGKGEAGCGYLVYRVQAVVFTIEGY
jgi:hypothetical protein